MLSHLVRSRSRDLTSIPRHVITGLLTSTQITILRSVRQIFGLIGDLKAWMKKETGYLVHGQLFRVKISFI